jgi:uncharacterized membrane protein YdbT with pleckstrin-like domain
MIKSKEKEYTLPLLVHIVITLFEGLFVIVYFLGLIQLFLPTFQFENKFLEMGRAMLVMLLLPLAMFIVPFFIYSTAVLIYYRFSNNRLWLIKKGLFNVHLIYEVFFLLFILFWLLYGRHRYV